MHDRRPYLIKRLNAGEITLEEARELFSGMSQELTAFRTRMAQQQAPPTPPPPPGMAPPASEGARLNVGLEEMLLFIGPAAGIFAAILKRSREGS
jgi:hypothetical protein